MIINKKIKFKLDNITKIYDEILYRLREKLKAVISNNNGIDLCCFLEINKKFINEINSDNFDALYYGIYYFFHSRIKKRH